MNKVFLYLYPIKEYTSVFLFHDDGLYDRLNISRPLPILNEVINKRYRQKGYQVVYVLYPDKELYGIDKIDNDKIIYTDITFSEVSAYDYKEYEKKRFIPKYPNELLLLEQLGNIDELVVGGYHAMDCVKRVAQESNNLGIKTLIDLDLTDLFFSIYQTNYFDLNYYSPEKFKNYMINRYGTEYSTYEEKKFDKYYSSPVYGFKTLSRKK